MIQKEFIDKLYKYSILSAKEFDELLSQHDDEDSEYLFKLARNLRKKYYGKDVYIRGLIEFSNYLQTAVILCKM